MANLVNRLSHKYRNLAHSPVGGVLGFARRAYTVGNHLAPIMLKSLCWLFTSRETTNATYDISERSIDYICATLSVALSKPFAELRQYANEAVADRELADHVVETTRASIWSKVAEPAFRIGRRIGWYVIVRAKKPRVVIETGVDKGLGAVVIAAALLKNRSEGDSGRYFGTDIKPEAGYLLSGKYKSVGTILYGDSIASLEKFDENIDLFINDSDHSSDYEKREYQTIRNKLTPDSIIVGDNAHATNELFRFSREIGWAFLFIHEEPLDHWYPGAGIGLCFLPKH